MRPDMTPRDSKRANKAVESGQRLSTAFWLRSKPISKPYVMQLPDATEVPSDEAPGLES